MPDLGKYADTVLAAYGVSILLVALIVIFSVYRGRRIRSELDRAEERSGRDG